MLLRCEGMSTANNFHYVNPCRAAHARGRKEGRKENPRHAPHYAPWQRATATCTTIPLHLTSPVPAPDPFPAVLHTCACKRVVSRSFPCSSRAFHVQLLLFFTPPITPKLSKLPFWLNVGISCTLYIPTKFSSRCPAP